MIEKSSRNKKETAVLVSVNLDRQDAAAHEYMDELEFLAKTAGAKTLKRFMQNLDKHHNKYYVGPGKLEEIQKYVEDKEVDMVIFDDELTPSQIKNIERQLNCKVLDRANLILDIFASRAKTAQAKAQVDLAQLEYLLPRLTNMWSHLSRQKGGIGMKGPGEKEIETDRRIIRTRIALLKEKLEKIRQQNTTQRKARKEKIRVALVGYTNVGKSTIMNILSDAQVTAENKLFATLDTTVRKVFEKNLSYLLSDTVGFIRKLPHELVESFKSTLDEAREADLLVHVVDVSHPQFEHQIKVVNQTLQELGAFDKPMLIVFNKLDMLQSFGEEDWQELTLDEKRQRLENTTMKGQAKEATFISAGNNFGINTLRSVIYEMVKEEYRRIYPYLNDPESLTPSWEGLRDETEN